MLSPDGITWVIEAYNEFSLSEGKKRERRSDAQENFLTPFFAFPFLSISAFSFLSSNRKARPDRSDRSKMKIMEEAWSNE